MANSIAVLLVLEWILCVFLINFFNAVNDLFHLIIFAASAGETYVWQQVFHSSIFQPRVQARSPVPSACVTGNHRNSRRQVVRTSQATSGQKSESCPYGGLALLATGQLI